MPTSAQDTSITDGPYVFYDGRQVIIESIRNDLWVKDSIVKKGKKDYRLNVLVQRPAVSFSVRFKTSLNNEPAVYKPADKMFVLSDIEGTFEGMSKLLLAGGVIDQQFNWAFGNGHLVICGDVLDRGNEVTACLWLLYKLEDEAKAKGGYVHVILGNHEIMNLSDDTRFVNAKYMKAAAIMEKSYKDLYNTSTELGRWLRTKNVIEKIGPWLCLHGGISEAINNAGPSLEHLNSLARPYYDKSGQDSLLAEAQVLPLFADDTSPFWYRGYVIEPEASAAQVDNTLKIFDVKHIIVGHTIVDSIHTRYNNKVITMDVNYHAGNYQALIIEKDNFYRMTATGEKRQLN